jgi:glycosyltransferase involved in cell wall biosynthesis
MHASIPQQPLRLLFLTDSPITVSGGSERFLRNLVNKLHGERFSLSVVQLCDEPSSDTQVYRNSVPTSIDVSYLPCRAVYGASGLRAYRILRQRVLEEGFHVIQSQHENSDIINALLPRGPLRAVRISCRRDTGFLKSPRLRLASSLLNHRYDRIVAPTPAILDAVASDEHASRDHMLCIPNGVDTTRFRPPDASMRQRVRDSLGLGQDALLVGCVADLFAVKRHIDLIDAFARVHGEIPQARLVLIGDGPLRTTIETRTCEQHLSEAVFLLGSRKDVAELLPAFDLFALASDTEGMSNAILEAQACGLPVIATHVGGNPDLVDDTCGQLVAPRDSDALAAAMLPLLRDPGRRERMGVAGRTRVERNHSLDAMAEAYASLYRECAHVC